MEQLGPYQLKEVLGRGGMGTVYRAHDTLHHRDVAVKVVAPSLAAIDGFRDRFQSEIHSLEKLHHPNIVELFGYGEEHGHLFYAMELVTGGSLQQELSEGCRFSWRDVIRYAIDVCGALKHAHDCGIIHRDIKPANLLLDHEGNLKLSDFGIAKLFGETQRTLAGSIVGTADFMSPEQAEGLPVTPRSDLYSLGCVMYALLTGSPPFRGKSVPEVIHKVRFEPPLPIHRQGVEIPSQLELVIDQLLAKDPERRIPTPLALAKRLQAIEQECSVTGGQPYRTVVDEGAPVRSSSSSAALKMSLGREVAGAHSWVDTSETLDAVEPRPGATSEITSPLPGTAPPPVRQFTLVDDAYRRQLAAEPTESRWQSMGRATLLVLALCILAIGSWQVIRPSTANELYAKIKRASEGGFVTVIVDAQRREFLDRFPDDPRAAEVRQWQDDAQLDRLERSLVSRERSDDQSDLVIEDWLRQSLQWQEFDPARAARQLQAILELYGDASRNLPTERRYLQLASRNLARLQKEIRRRADLHQARVEEWLDQARASTGARRRLTCESILTLYADQDWAQSYLAEARELLAEQAESSPPPAAPDSD